MHLHQDIRGSVLLRSWGDVHTRIPTRQHSAPGRYKQGVRRQTAGERDGEWIIGRSTSRERNASLSPPTTYSQIQSVPCFLCSSVSLSLTMPISSSVLFNSLSPARAGSLPLVPSPALLSPFWRDLLLRPGGMGPCSASLGSC